MPDGSATIRTNDAWWSSSAPALFDELAAAPAGLSSAEAESRLARFGRNELTAIAAPSVLRIFVRQFASPLVLILVAAAAAAWLASDLSDAAIVLTIVAVSTGIAFVREYGAGRALEKLQARIGLRGQVMRDGRVCAVPFAEVVPGDVALLSAGSLIPGDGVLLEANDLFVIESVLTGESFPTEKRPGVAPAVSTLAERMNCVFLGTSVRSGTARCLIVRTGNATEFGAIAGRLALRAPESEFDRGLRRFGYLLTWTMSVLVLLVFALNVHVHRATVDALLFSVALAVGLTPELLPAILSVNLAQSARKLARHGVLVRRLSAIENFGAMDILCTDKTGTLTEGVIRLEGAVGADGASSDDVLQLARLNAGLQTGLANPLDEAILAGRSRVFDGIEKCGEIPYDFVRKRLSVVVREGGRARIVTKGACPGMLDVCTRIHGEREAVLDDARRAELVQRFEAWSESGLRVLGIAVGDVVYKDKWRREDERDLAFAGFLLFLDPPRAGIADELAELARLGVGLKIVTGDNVRVGRHIAAAVGMQLGGVLRGADLDAMRDEALWHAAERTDLFAEVDPNQKERIILALKKTGHVVGYMGDGINDAPALHAADVGISVEQAADVARQAADFVLLERNVHVLRNGIVEGRTTFANTLKYVMTTTSANLGNMTSMAVASAFLPFLPLLSGQILLNNLLSDLPALALSSDAVDPELVERPRRWDNRFLRRFMIQFGLLSSAFDFLTFGALLWIFRAAPEEFRTAWFVESLLTELAVALVVRTRRSVLRSKPGRMLVFASVAVALVAIALPYLPQARWLGFVPMPPALLAAVIGITLVYVAATELLKAHFYSRGTR